VDTPENLLGEGFPRLLGKPLRDRRERRKEGSEIRE